MAAHYHNLHPVVYTALAMTWQTPLAEFLGIIWPILSSRASDRALWTIDLLNNILQNEGPIHREGSQLFAGSLLLNDERDLLPKVSRATGLGLSLYLGNRRIASAGAVESTHQTSKHEFADAFLVDLVLRKRESFCGELRLFGRAHIVACRPFGPAGETNPTGMIEALFDLDGFRQQLHTTLQIESVSVEAELEERAERMRQISRFIDDVARRLQLLALNGNIIAAQAGEHGRAFRVVCRELSVLANQAKHAVGEVENVIVDLGLVQPQTDGEDT